MRVRARSCRWISCEHRRRCASRCAPDSFANSVGAHAACRSSARARGSRTPLGPRTPSASGTCGRCRRARSAARAGAVRSMVWPKNAVPASGRVLPVMTSIIVVLPAPFGPMMQRSSPTSIVERQRVQRLEAVEADADRRRGRGSRRASCRGLRRRRGHSSRSHRRATAGRRPGRATADDVGAHGVATASSSSASRSACGGVGGGTGGASTVTSSGERRVRTSLRNSPTMPCGRNSVTSMNSEPRKYSQNSGNACVNQLFAPLTKNGADDRTDQRAAAADRGPDRHLDRVRAATSRPG